MALVGVELSHKVWVFESLIMQIYCNCHHGARWQGGGEGVPITVNMNNITNVGL